MKYFAAITLACVGATVGMPQMGPIDAMAGAAAPAAPATAAGTGAVAPLWGNTRNWGAKAYGQGLNNPWAVPVNPIQMQAMVKMAESFPNLLVRVDVDGEMQFTNQFGMEVDSPFDAYENAFDF